MMRKSPDMSHPPRADQGSIAGLTRRSVLLAAGGMSVLSVARAEEALAGTAPRQSVARLPDKTSFAATDLTYLDSGSQHPISLGAKAAIETYLARRALDPAAAAYELPENAVREKFARLVNVEADEIAYVQSTTTAEQMILRGLGLPGRGAHIVTDTLHFFGSLPIYEEMSRQGVEVTWLRPRDGRILISDMKRAIRRGTRLVSVSLVSTINGFEHDLKAVCDIAHDRGALVYADIIHAAGCIPLDLRASGVDFAACASYKWLMGDFGLGFVYASRQAQRHLRQTEYGYYGLSAFTPHIYPHDTPGKTIVDYAFAPTAEGHFAHGTYCHTVVAQLNHSLDYIMTLGVTAIQAHAQSLTSHLKTELPKLGYTLMTPPEATTPLVTCVLENAHDKLAQRMNAAKVRITTSGHRFRATPSVFNDHADIERFLAALGRA